jgi:lauroyl/myristoyl acyltransferase
LDRIALVCATYFKKSNQSQPVAESFRELRRAITQLAIRKTIDATASLPIGSQRSNVIRLVALAGRVPMLRRKVRDNMRLALGEDVPVLAERQYFRHVGWFVSSALATFHRGLAATPVVHEVKFDQTISALDDAFAEGRGVVLTVPHWTGHELVAGVIARRHPMVMLVRQAPTPERAARKAKWYRALGAETVLRPKHASTLKDAVAYLKVLKSGKMLAVTPDLLADPSQGVEISIFGRPARLNGGAFALAIAAKAPMIRISGVWQSDSSVVLTFERAPPPPDSNDREAVIRACIQDWCSWFEQKLRANPENWLFWLDKRWSRFLHVTPRTSCME